MENNRQENRAVSPNGRLFTGIALFAVICAAIVVSVNRGKKDTLSSEPLKIQGFAFDTAYQITLYEGGDEKLLQSCVSRCSEYEAVISRTKEDSEVNRINSLSKEYFRLLTDGQQTQLLKGNALTLTQEESGKFETALREKFPEAFEDASCRIEEDGGISFGLSDYLWELVQSAEKYGILSKGCFTMAIEPVSSLWDFTSEKPKAPEKEAIQKALPFVTNAGITLADHRMCFALPGTGVEFGGIAKGYIADLLKEELAAGGVKAGLIDLGGNILCIGSKQGGDAFYIGIQQPFADRNEVIATVAVKDCSVVSSGIYERCFEQDGVFYHHILQPSTGEPVDNDLMAVTIISKRSVDGDGLSTTCFGLGLEQGLELINSLEDVTAVFITKDEKLHYADGFESYLSDSSK